LLTRFAFLLILAAKTLVTLSIKDREKGISQNEVEPSASRSGLASMLGEHGKKFRLSFCLLIFDFLPSSYWRCEGYTLDNVAVDYFADFEQTLEDLSADDLMKVVRAYLSRGIVACQKGFERAASEAKTSVDKQKVLEDENRRLREENEKLRRDADGWASQRVKHQEALDALKRELE
jgi:hypothetical protein